MNEYKAKALEIAAEWNAKSGEERLNFCRNCVLKGIREGRRLAHGDELDDAINSTYELVAGKLLDIDKLAKNIERRASQGFTDSLAAIISRAAKATLAGAADTERAATIRATLKKFFAGLDSKNKIIFGGMVKGMTEREIAPTVEISNIAVHKRMVKIRAELAELL